MLAGLGLLFLEIGFDIQRLSEAYLNLVLGKVMTGTDWYLVLLGVYTGVWTALWATSIPEMIRPPKPKLEPLPPLPESKKWTLERNHPAIVTIRVDTEKVLAEYAKHEEQRAEELAKDSQAFTALSPAAAGEEDLSAFVGPGGVFQATETLVDDVLREIQGTADPLEVDPVMAVYAEKEAEVRGLTDDLPLEAKDDSALAREVSSELLYDLRTEAEQQARPRGPRAQLMELAKEEDELDRLTSLFN